MRNPFMVRGQIFILTKEEPKLQGPAYGAGNNPHRTTPVITPGGDPNLIKTGRLLSYVLLFLSHLNPTFSSYFEVIIAHKRLTFKCGMWRGAGERR